MKHPIHARDEDIQMVSVAYQEKLVTLQSDKDVLATHGKTFSFAARFFPEEVRSAVSTLYAFFRVLDDLVDEPGQRTPDQIRAELEAWRDWFLRDCRGPAPRVALGGRLQAVLKEHPIPTHLFLDFLAGLFSDLECRDICTFEDLHCYCYGVAGTVGLAMAHLLGVRSEQALAAAKQLGIAMQMTNILRDVGGDLARGRIYMPADERERFGCSDRYLVQLYAEEGEPDERFRALMRFQVARAYHYYDQGLHGIWLLPAHYRLPILIAGRLYRRILTVIEKRQYDVLHRRASTGILLKAREAVVALVLIRLWRWGETVTVSDLEVILEN